jgi:hypothetical protein
VRLGLWPWIEQTSKNAVGRCELKWVAGEEAGSIYPHSHSLSQPVPPDALTGHLLRDGAEGMANIMKFQRRRGVAGVRSTCASDLRTAGQTGSAPRRSAAWYQGDHIDRPGRRHGLPSVRTAGISKQKGARPPSAPGLRHEGCTSRVAPFRKHSGENWAADSTGSVPVGVMLASRLGHLPAV